MRPITILQPRRMAFGEGCTSQCADDLLGLGLSRVFVVTSPPIVGLAEPLADRLRQNGATVAIHPGIDQEPSVGMFQEAVQAARVVKPDAVIGLGGGSAMDVAKLVAALHDSQQTVRQAFGINQLASRQTYLACLPTTAGTGSEVSPNAILTNEEEQLKRGIISPHLVPDAAYVDPVLTVTLPPAVTAATGVDALTHCIEAYANRFAHPMIDIFALQGIRLIADNLVQAVKQGDDLQVRGNMALGSLYGGLCLGPVNTGAVHALAYPLGGEFHIPHGVSNALLLTPVIEFNLSAAPDRYANVALALGVEAGSSASETARRGLQRIRELCRDSGIPASMSELGIPQEAIPRMAQSAMKVTRLLKNNLRELTTADAESIYRAVA